MMDYDIFYWLCPRCMNKCCYNERDAQLIDGIVMRKPKHLAAEGECACGFEFPFNDAMTYRHLSAIPRKL